MAQIVRMNKKSNIQICAIYKRFTLVESDKTQKTQKSGVAVLISGKIHIKKETMTSDQEAIS